MGFHSDQGWVHITVFIPCGEQRIVYLCVCLVGTPPSELIPGNPQQCCWQTTHRIKVWSVRQWEESERWKWGSGRTKEKNQMWCDAMWCSLIAAPNHRSHTHTHIWIHSHIHTHSQTNGCVPAVAEYVGSHLWVTPSFLAGARFGRKMKGSGCMPADPTCCMGPVDPLILNHLSPVQPSLSSQRRICLSIRLTVSVRAYYECLKIKTNLKWCHI